MKKRLLLSTILLLQLTAWAVPAKPGRHSVPQKDGTTLTLTLRGDEHFHYLQTEDGMPVMKADDEGYYYATLEEGEALMPSSLLAHDALQRSDAESLFVAAHANSIRQRLSATQQQHVGRANSRRAASRRPAVYEGNKRGLVILVNFRNLEMKSGSAGTLKRMFNEKGYSGNRHIGSVRDYFYDQSYGKLDIEFDVIGPVTVSQDYSYYGANDSQTGSDKRPATMVAEACKLVDDDVNFANYDWDDDGEVDQVFVVYAGYAESSGAEDATIWPHEYSLTYARYYGDGEGALRLDGTRIDTYACASELDGTRGSNLGGIGTACHEFSHCLGLPDFYDTADNGCFGMSVFDVMDQGCYSGPNVRGEIPCGYTAYERSFIGWMKLKEVSAGMHVEDLRNLGDEPVAYAMYNDNYPNEYFVLENRQAQRWFSYVLNATGCHGMMVTHIDYSQSSWRQNTVNTNRSHQRCSIIPADNDYGEYDSEEKYYQMTLEGVRGDLFPGQKGVTTLSGDSHADVGGRLFHANKDGSYQMGLSLTNIQEGEDGVISFDVVKNTIFTAPTALGADHIGENSFTARWNQVEGADSYTLELVYARSQKPLRLTTEVLEDLTDTCHVFTDLSATEYNYRVRAIAAGVASAWSNMVTVSLTPSGITTASVADRDDKPTYYTLSGRQVQPPLQPGLYIVRRGGRSRLEAR